MHASIDFPIDSPIASFMDASMDSFLNFFIDSPIDSLMDASMDSLIGSPLDASYGFFYRFPHRFS